MFTITSTALTGLNNLRNEESESPNIGTILAAELFYIVLIPISIVETALSMVATFFVFVFASIQLLDGETNLSQLSQQLSPWEEWIKDTSFCILWASSTAIMNLLPVSILKTEEQAKQFFCYDEAISNDEQEIPEELQRPVRTNAMSGFLAPRVR